MSTNPLPAYTTSAASHRVSPHEFKQQHHHPVVHVMQHVISPLTASLFIFGIHKASQAPAVRASLRAMYTIFRARRQGVPIERMAPHRHGHEHRMHHHASAHTSTAAETAATASNATSAAPGVVGATQHRALHTAARSVLASVASSSCRPAAALSSHRLASAAAGLTTPRAQRASMRPLSGAAPRMNASRAAAGAASFSTTRVAAVATAGVGGGNGGSATPSSVREALISAAENSDIALTEVDLDPVIDPTPLVPDKPLYDLDALAQIYKSEDVHAVAEHITDWWSVHQVENLLYHMHDTMHLPWWATIVGATLVLRTALAFVNIGLMRNSLRMKIITPEIEKLEHAIVHAKSDAEAVDASLRMKQLFKDSRCSPFHQMLSLPLLLPPTILSIFGAVHNISMAEPSMAVEGALWFPDLIAVDSTYLLPILSGLTWLWNVELGAGVYYHHWYAPKLAARVMSVAFIPLTATLPSGVFVFWLTSNLFAIARTYIMRLDTARNLLLVPLAKDVAKLKHLPKPSSH